MSLETEKRPRGGRGAGRPKRPRRDVSVLHTEEELLGGGSWRGQDVVVETDSLNFLHAMCRAASAMHSMGLMVAGAPPTFRLHESGQSGASPAGEIVNAPARRARRPTAVSPHTALTRVPGGVVRDGVAVWTWGFDLIERAFRGGDQLGRIWEHVASAESAPHGLVRVCEELRAQVRVPMFEYQWRCVAFMLHREQQLDAARHLVPLTLADDRKHLLLRSWALRAGAPARTPEAAVLEMRGGCILDEPGMGKTRQVLAAALLDRGEAAAAPRGLTLVVCKSHLVRQWKIEADELGMEVRSCVSVPQLRNLTLEVLRSTSVVVVSLSTLERYAHAHSYASAPGAWRGVHLERCHFRRVVVDEAHSVLLPDPRIMDVNPITRLLGELSADFRWAVTGTPSLLAARPLAWFLGLRLDGARIVDPEHGLPGYVPLAEAAAHMMRSMTIRRVARARLGERLPEVVVHTLPVDLLPDEMRVVNTLTSPESVRRALCHPQAAEEYKATHVHPVRVADLLGARIQDGEAGLAQAERRIARQQAVIAGLTRRRAALEATQQKEPAACGGGEHAERVAAVDCEVAICRKRLEALRGHRRALQSRVAYLRNAVSASEEPCIVCTDSIVDVRAVTECGHSTCAPCMDAVLEVSRACPICRAPISNKTITRIRDPIKDRPAGTGGDPGQESLRERVGSKTAAITTWLRNTLARDPGARVLVYCMYDRYLRIMDAVFRAEGIETGWIMGNAPRRDAVVKDFQAGRIPVLLASLAHAAEGLNLTRGTHVLFVHPMDELQHDLIRQAGGRINRLGQAAPRVHYVYAFTRNTVEQVLLDKYPRDLAPAPSPDPAEPGAAPPSPRVSA